MRPNKRALVIEENRNPSSDFFVVPELQKQGYSVEFVCHRLEPRDVDTKDALLVFVRYIPRSWRAAVDSEVLGESGLVYFADDDLFESASLRGLPWRYRRKIHKLAGPRLKRWLVQNNSVSCWVNSEYLQGRYPELSCDVVKAKPASPAPEKTVTVFYHGSASHIAEMRWLLPVMQEVLQQESRIRFELIGNPEVYKAFRALPRTSVLMPMNWLAYQALLSTGGRHIGLAPLLDSSFNKARSPTKFFDITAAGACGLYAQHPAYEGFVRQNEDGFLLSMDAERWVAKILELARDDVERERLGRAAADRCAKIAG